VQYESWKSDVVFGTIHTVAGYGRTAIEAWLFASQMSKSVVWGDSYFHVHLVRQQVYNFNWRRAHVDIKELTFFKPHKQTDENLPLFVIKLLPLISRLGQLV